MTPFRSASMTFARHKRAFIVTTLIFYVLFTVSLTATLLFPELKAQANALYDINNLKHPLLDFTYAGYAQGDLIQAAMGTFTVNLIVALLALIPSLVVPFSGVPYIYVRGFLWGAMFAPFGWERGDPLSAHAHCPDRGLCVCHRGVRRLCAQRTGHQAAAVRFRGLEAGL